MYCTQTKNSRKYYIIIGFVILTFIYLQETFHIEKASREMNMDIGFMDGSTLKFIIGIVPLLAYTINILTYFTSIIYGYVKFHKKPRISSLSGEEPGVSIVKPLMGLNPDIQENLETHFHLDYPKYELLFCVKEPDDEVIPLTKSLMAKYPHINSRLFVGGVAGMVNPMVENMAQGYNNASYDLVWICSGRIKVSTDILVDMVNKSRDPRVAIVHQVPFLLNHPGFASILDQVCFTVMARWYVAVNAIGILCMTGMSYIVKKPYLDSCGGLTYFGKYLAEDYFLSKALHEKGFKSPMCAYPAMQNGSDTTVKAIKARLMRWHRLRLNMIFIHSCIIEPIMQIIVLGLLTSISIWIFFDVNPLISFFCLVAINAVGDYILYTILEGKSIKQGKLQFFLAWIYREIAYYQLFIKTLMDIHVIKWGKRVYRVESGGITKVVDKSGPRIELI